MRPSRFLVLHCPTLPTDRIHREEPFLGKTSLATWATLGNRRLLMAVDAPGTRLHAGQALADAQAMYPDLVFRAADPAADRAFLERLALWALRFTPQVMADPPDGLVLDIAGCTEAPGGEQALLRRVVDKLERGGVRCRAMIADIADAGAALARAGENGTVMLCGQDRSRIEALPLSTLRLSPNCLAGLRRLGLRRIGDALRQPRAPLLRRFGRELLDALDAVTGDRPRPMTSVRPPAEFSVAEDYLDPIVTRPGIDRATGRLTERLCATLAEAGQGARRLTLRAFRVDGDVQELSLGTGLPTRTPGHLGRLFDQVLERLQPDLGFERITLQADETNAWTGGQDGMVAIGTDAHHREEALAELLDRLGQRLSLWRLAPVASHWPERAAQPIDAFSAVSMPENRLRQEHPVRLLARPTPLMVLASVPDGPPVQIRLDGAVHAVVWFDGPDRVEPEWWREPGERPGRDYWRVALGNGARLWLGRSGAQRRDRPPRWFLHGYLP